MLKLNCRNRCDGMRSTSNDIGINATIFSDNFITGTSYFIHVNQ